MSRNLAILLACSICLASTRADAAGGAYAVDDAQIVPTNTCQLELWISTARNKDFFAVLAPACTFEIVRPVEFKSEFQRVRASGVWGTALTVQGKTNILPVEPGRIGVAVSGSAAFDLHTGQYTGSLLNVPATLTVNDRLRFHVNAGWMHASIVDANWLFWGAAAEWTIAQPLVLLAEVYGQAGPALRDLPALNEPRMQVGLRYMPAETIDIDLIYGRNISGIRTDWITVGLTLRWGK